MKYNYIHNETYAYRLPPTFLEQTHALVDFHERGLFTDDAADGIGNSTSLYEQRKYYYHVFNWFFYLVAGRSVLPSIIKALERISVAKDPLSLFVQEMSYKPFISLFNITGLDERYPEISGLRKFVWAVSFHW